MGQGWDEERVGAAAGKNGVLPSFLRLLAAGVATLSLAILVLIYHVAPLLGGFLPVLQLPSIRLRDAEVEFANAGFELTPAADKNARMAAREAPLEADPFYYAAMDLDETREAGKILALLDETLKRNPRHHYARLWRARLYYKADRISDAVDEIVQLLTLDPGDSFDYVGALVDLASDPRSHSLLLSLVGKQPHWSDDFIRSANASLKDDNFLLALASQSKNTLDDYVGALASQGEFERAFLIWQASLTQAEMLAFSWPYDSSFKIQEGSSAFGWHTNSPMATRERDGLYVYFDGRGEKTAATQTVMLGQGYAYTLAVSMSGEIRPRGGFFRWSIKCVESGKIAAELDVTSTEAMPSTQSADFYIPEDGCAVQSISLLARPSEFTHSARVTVHDVMIREQLSDSRAPSSDNGPRTSEATDAKTGQKP